MAARKHVDRERVLETAITLADANGFEAVTLASVADCLGIRIPSLYNHVDGLPGLRRDMTLWGLRELADVLRRAAVGVSGEEAIIRVAEAYRAFAHAHPGVYAATLRAVPPEDTELSGIAAELVEIVVAVVKPYTTAEDDALHKVRAMRSVMHGFVHLELVGGFGMALDRDESFRRLVRLFILGLKEPG
jgi:AcrR family transcriptional regulator